MSLLNTLSHFLDFSFQRPSLLVLGSQPDRQSSPQMAKPKGESLTTKDKRKGQVFPRRSQRKRKPGNNTTETIISKRKMNAEKARERAKESFTAPSTTDSEDWRELKDVKSLQEKLEVVTKKKARIQTHLDEIFTLHLNDVSFPSDYEYPELDEWARNVNISIISIEDWAWRHALGDTKDIQGLSGDDKKYIISSLEGYCLQDDDFDNLISRFPDPACQFVPELFFSVFLVKDMLQRFYANKFWSMTLDPARTAQDEQKDHQDQQLRETMTKLYEIFRNVDPRRSHHWKALTNQLSNTTGNPRESWFYFGNRAKEYRESLVESFVSEVLSSRMARLLLKPETEKARAERHKHLVQIYKSASKDAIAGGNCEYWLEFPCIEACATDYTLNHFDHRSDPASLSSETCLDGKAVLLVTQPRMLGCFQRFNDPATRETLRKPVVVVEEDICADKAAI